jgi:polygalacturonase
MVTDLNARRRFLKAASAGLLGGELISLPETLDAQNLGQQSVALPVTRLGAKGDGKAFDTPAINNAIDQASRAGGGIVFFPAGTYLCHSIHLKSHITLYLAPGATILGADSTAPGERGGYDLAESNQPCENYQDFGHNHWHNSLVWGDGLENVAIVGSGLIWGRGLSKGYGPGPVAEQPGVGNKAIALKNCRNVLLRDFSILYGGHFGILATGVDNLTIDNLTIDTNRDGMDIDCCRNVRVSNCSVNSPWDDGICLKSSYALGYARATEMVTITNCMVSGSFEEGTLIDATFKRFPPEERIFRAGRIKFGTESNGGFKNITISNCVFDGCHGLAIESVDGAVIEDVSVNNITMRELYDAPIFVRLGARMRGPAGAPVGVIRRLSIGNVSCVNAPNSKICSIISGIPGHRIEDLSLTDITILQPGGATAQDAARQLPEEEQKYPEPTMFGVTPAQGFFIRHAKGVTMTGIKVECAGQDARPAFVLDDVEAADFHRLKLPANQPKPAFVLKQVEDFSLSRSKPWPDTELNSVASQEI